MSHTKWTVEKAPNGDYEIWDVMVPELITGKIEKRETAEHIVKMHNSFPAVVEALKGSLESIESILDSSNISTYAEDLLTVIHLSLKSAIAKAEGE